MNDEEEKYHEIRHFSGLAFVACMFIGAGIGLLFNRPDVGGCIGMGVGFLLIGFLRARGVELKSAISIPKTLPSIVLTVIGLLMILVGVSMIFYPELLWPYITGLIAIAIGLLIYWF